MRRVKSESSPLLMELINMEIGRDGRKSHAGSRRVAVAEQTTAQKR